MSIHWGVEYKTTPHEWDVRIAHKILEGGVDGIIGHHPHVLQPLEVRETEDGRTAFVIYSLGNFISGQGYQYRHGLHGMNVGNTRDGGLLRFKVVRKDYGDGHTAVALADLRFDPIWVIRQTAHPRTYPVVGRVEIDRLNQAIVATEDPDERHALQESLQVVTDRRLHAGGVVGELWLTPLAPVPAADRVESPADEEQQ
jgi:poly-gamma-glutamate synthesis protein (capsule biosynthesis protein)